MAKKPKNHIDMIFAEYMNSQFQLDTIQSYQPEVLQASVEQEFTLDQQRIRKSLEAFLFE